jgi:soluble lytic murein transglycosylase-like protein
LNKGAALALLLGVCLNCATTPALGGARGKQGASQFRSDYDQYFRKYAKHTFGVGTDWSWFKAQAIAESNLNPAARSSVAAKGVMQIMPATYAELQKKNPELGAIDDPRWNIAAGIAYDRQLWNRLSEWEDVSERRRFMFGAYNAGHATITRARRVAAAEGQADKNWNAVAQIAPKVPKWRHRETLGYIDRIETFQAQIR